jgi:hypothetical protein
MQKSRVPFLVLANLGLLPFAACKQEEGPPVAAPTSGPMTAQTTTTAPTATPAATATTTATSTATTTATSTTAPTATGISERQCTVDADCGDGSMECLHLASSADAGGGSGRCQRRHNYHLGRPLLVEGSARLASYAQAPQVSTSELMELLRAAREEHASIAAFARTVSELMALGAPLSLLQKTQAALGDEIRHTEMTLDLLEAATGQRPVLGGLADAVAPLRSGPDAARELFVDVLRGGVIGETLAAAHAESQRASARSEALRSFYGTIMEDESRHAALALETAQWLLAHEPSLRAVLAEESRALAESGSFEARTLVLPLLAVLG